jgi:magnesium-transporting ATPase (P-type)
LPALALGNEAPSPGTLRRPPEHRHLIDRALLVRAFGVLGPTLAAAEMTAFLVSLSAAGWRAGQHFPTGHALAASTGAAFGAVVVGQIGTALACRSATRPITQVGPFTNRLLLLASGVAVALLVGLWLVGPLARLLHHAAPPAAGVVAVVLAAPAVLAADTIHKAVRLRRRPAST